MDATEICNMLDADLVNFIHNIIVVIKIAVPVILVIFGMLDFAKGVMAGKEDEIKKGQQVFIKRLIAAAVVFLVVTLVQLVMSLISSEDNSFWNCADQILNGTAGSTYEPTGVTGKSTTDNNNDNTNTNPSDTNNNDVNNSNNTNNNTNNNNSNNNTNNNNTNNNNGESSQKSSGSHEQQNGETDYQGEGLINNNNNINDGGTTTTTTTTTTTN